LLSPLFLPFDGFSVKVNPHVLLLFALSMTLWALVDAFLFSAFKYEEASVLAAIFPLNFVVTFAISVVFFSSVIKHFSIPPYMLAAFLFPAIINLFIFLRPKRSEMQYELKKQWKMILLNAAAMDASYFFLLKAFQRVWY
jgi:drug/metabolite transporter (DMT)-like permease